MGEQACVCMWEVSWPLMGCEWAFHWEPPISTFPSSLGLVMVGVGYWDTCSLLPQMCCLAGIICVGRDGGCGYSGCRLGLLFTTPLSLWFSCWGKLTLTARPGGPTGLNALIRGSSFDRLEPQAGGPWCIQGQSSRGPGEALTTSSAVSHLAHRVTKSWAPTQHTRAHHAKVCWNIWWVVVYFPFVV